MRNMPGNQITAVSLAFQPNHPPPGMRNMPGNQITAVSLAFQPNHPPPKPISEVNVTWPVLKACC